MLEQIANVPVHIADLKRKLGAREGKPGYEKNCEAIRAEIARLEAVTVSPGALASKDDVQ